MDKLVEYRGRRLVLDGRAVVELRDPNDNARHRYQYRLGGATGIERRTLPARGHAAMEWESVGAGEIGIMHAQRGYYHPILDGLGYGLHDRAAR